MFSGEVLWENKETFGCEYLDFLMTENSIFAESTVIYLNASSPVQIDYQIELDRLWRTKRVSIKNRRGKHLLITSNGEGQWFDEKGEPVRELNGAIDVDISATPFSNSLPINRFGWEPLQSRKFEMVYVSVPTLEVQKMKQTYTLIEDKEKVRRFKYQSPGFESLISVDEKGFVVDYPQLFKRRYSDLA